MSISVIAFIALSAVSADTASLCNTRTVSSSDSATIILPPYLTNLAETQPHFEIAPRCPVTKVDLYVSRYQVITDTLAHLSTPPYKAKWDISSVPDLDQYALSFGYILYHKNGDTIVSGPQVNRWVIDRKAGFSKKRLLCRELSAKQEIKIDGSRDDWGRIRRHKIENRAAFYCTWTPGSFYLFVKVRDANVSAWDRVETHFDLHRSRTSFADERHRWISFGPKGRSFSSVVALSDSGPKQIDSIIVRISDEIEWRARANADGYVIEARIPFCVLSEFEFPPKKFGFDVAILDRKNRAAGSLIAATWAGARVSNRHNPSEWGTIALRQTMLPLKITLISLITAACAILVLFGVIFINQKRKEHYFRMIDARPYSPHIQQLFDLISRQFFDTALSLDAAARSIGSSAIELQERLKAETGATFEMILSNMRIKNAKQLLRDTDNTIADIAQRCGYAAVHSFEADFKRFAGTTPRKYRQQIAEELQQRQEEEQE